MNGNFVISDSDSMRVADMNDCVSCHYFSEAGYFSFIINIFLD